MCVLPVLVLLVCSGTEVGTPSHAANWTNTHATHADEADKAHGQEQRQRNSRSITSKQSKDTKPKPLELPVSGSLMILGVATMTPNALKVSYNNCASGEKSG